MNQRATIVHVAVAACSPQPLPSGGTARAASGTGDVRRQDGMISLSGCCDSASAWMSADTGTPLIPRAVAIGGDCWEIRWPGARFHG
jgi:hypothetical protein